MSVDSFSDAIIMVSEVLDAVNALPLDTRRLVASALRERSPRYCWTVERHGQLTCRDDAQPLSPEWLRPWASDDDS